jgi:Proton-conducting membrane transporter
MEKLDHNSFFFDQKEFLNAYVKKCFYYKDKEFFIEQFKEIFFTKTIVNYSLVKNFKEMLNDFIQNYCSFLKKNNNFVVKSLNYSFLEFGLTLILFSLFIKLALAPFHTWLLDVYEGVPVSSALCDLSCLKVILRKYYVKTCISSEIRLSFEYKLMRCFVY